MTKLWWERIKDIKEIAPTFGEADVKIAMEHATIPFHPGPCATTRRSGSHGRSEPSRPGGDRRPARASTVSRLDRLLGWGRSPQTVLAAAIVVLSLALGLFQFYSTYFGQAEGHTHRSTHLAFMLLLAFLVFPLGRRSFADPLTWHFAVDLAIIAVILAAQLWTLVHIHRFVDPNYTATTGDVVLGTRLILAVLEATRRTVGWALTLTAVFFLVQTWKAEWFFWIFYGPSTPWWTMVESFFGKEEGALRDPHRHHELGADPLHLLFDLPRHHRHRRILRAGRPPRWPAVSRADPPRCPSSPARSSARSRGAAWPT